MYLFFELLEEESPKRSLSFFLGKMNLADSLQVVTDSFFGFINKARQSFGVLTHRPSLHLSELHIGRQIQRRLGVQYNIPLRIDALVDIFHDDSKSEEVESGVGMFQINEMFCQVEPGCQTILNVVSEELDQGVA